MNLRRKYFKHSPNKKIIFTLVQNTCISMRIIEKYFQKIDIKKELQHNQERKTCLITNIRSSETCLMFRVNALTDLTTGGRVGIHFRGDNADFRLLYEILDRVIDCLFYVPSRIYHLYQDVTRCRWKRHPHFNKVVFKTRIH